MLAVTAHQTEAADAGFSRAVDIAGRLLANTETVVHGKREEIRMVLAALACGGDGLFVGGAGAGREGLGAAGTSCSRTCRARRRRFWRARSPAASRARRRSESSAPRTCSRPT